MDKSFRDYWIVLRRRWWLLFLSIAAGAIAIAVSWSTYTVSYEALSAAIVTNYSTPSSSGAKAIADYYSPQTLNNIHIYNEGPLIKVSLRLEDPIEAKDISERVLRIILEDFHKRQASSLKELDNLLSTQFKEGSIASAQRMTTAIAGLVSTSNLETDITEKPFDLWMIVSLSLILSLMVGTVAITVLETWDVKIQSSGD